jgi:hypothetical protein
MSIDTQEQLKFENAFQQLLINLAIQFINHPVTQMDDAITDALRQIVEFLGSTRATISKLSDDQAYFSSLYQWAQTLDKRLPIEMIAVPERDRNITLLSSGSEIKITDRNELTEDDGFRQFLSDWNIAAIVVVPILQQGKLIGFVSTSWSKPQAIQTEMISLP